MTNALIFGLLVLGVTLVGAGLALLVALLPRRHRDTPVEGLDGLSGSLRAGRDMSTGGMYRSRAGSRYTGSHRRTGPSKWLAHLGRTHHRRSPAKVRDLP